jgi:hypothetical protein
MDVSSDKSGKLACAGAGGSLGLAALAGACTAGCGFAAAPLAAFLTSVGLGAVSAFLSTLRTPFILIAVLLGAFAMWSFVRRKKVISAAVCGCVMGAGGAFLGWQMLQVSDCKTASTIETVLLKLSPQAREVLQKGVYPLWPELGRAPTLAEVQQRLGFSTEEPVLAAFSELEKLGFHGIFYPGTKAIKWFWPFSSLDHGVEVTLEGSRPVHARCAIDALGMSAMFGKVAKVLIKSPVDGQDIEMEISNHKIIKTSPGVVVSYSESCDDMLFFASEDEFSRYVKATGKSYLKLYSLQEALDQGIRSFGRVLKV